MYIFISRIYYIYRFLKKEYCIHVITFLMCISICSLRRNYAFARSSANKFYHTKSHRAFVYPGLSIVTAAPAVCRLQERSR